MERLLKDHSIGELAGTLELAASGFHAHRHKAGRLRRRQDAVLPTIN
jgi:hypothetical protein